MPRLHTGAGTFVGRSCTVTVLVATCRKRSHSKSSARDQLGDGVPFGTGVDDGVATTPGAVEALEMEAGRADALAAAAADELAGAELVVGPAPVPPPIPSPRPTPRLIPGSFQAGAALATARKAVPTVTMVFTMMATEERE